MNTEKKSFRETDDMARKSLKTHAKHYSQASFLEYSQSRHRISASPEASLLPLCSRDSDHRPVRWAADSYGC